MAVGLDALVILLAVKSPETAVLNVVLAVLGSAAGNLVLYYAALKGGEKYRHGRQPEGRTRRFSAWFHRYGLLTVFVPAATPIPMPLKAFVILSGIFKIRPLAFISSILLARTLRYGGEAYLAVHLGDGAIEFLSSHRWHLLGFAVLLFAVLYLVARFGPKPAVPDSGLIE